MENTSLMYSDLIRIAAIAFGVVVFILAWFIVWTFWRRISYDERSKIMTSYARAVASHILPTAIGVTTIVTAAIVEMFSRFGEPVGWRSPVYLIAFATLTFSLGRFARQQIAMYQASRNFYEASKSP